MKLQCKFRTCLNNRIEKGKKKKNQDFTLSIRCQTRAFGTDFCWQFGLHRNSPNLALSRQLQESEKESKYGYSIDKDSKAG